MWYEMATSIHWPPPWSLQRKPFPSRQTISITFIATTTLACDHLFNSVCVKAFYAQTHLDSAHCDLTDRTFWWKCGFPPKFLIMFYNFVFFSFRRPTLQPWCLRKLNKDKLLSIRAGISPRPNPNTRLFWLPVPNAANQEEFWHISCHSLLSKWCWSDFIRNSVLIKSYRESCPQSTEAAAGLLSLISGTIPISKGAKQDWLYIPGIKGAESLMPRIFRATMSCMSSVDSTPTSPAH